MPNDHYYQEYGPIHRRRSGEVPPEEVPEPPAPKQPEQPEREPARRRRVLRRRQPSGLWRWLVFGILLLIIAAPYAIDLAYAAQPLPRVSVQGTAVDGLNRLQLLEQLEARYGRMQREPITLSYRDQQWQPTLRDLSVELDLEQLADDALQFGRHGDPVTRVRELWQLAQGGVDLAPQLVVDLAGLQRYLIGLISTIDNAPVNGVLSLADARVIGQSSLPGTQLLVDATANDILLALQQMVPQTVPVRTRTLPALIDDADLLAAQQAAQQMLQSPLELRIVDEEPIVWEPARLAELLSVMVNDGTLQIAIDTVRLERAVEGLAQQIDSGTAEPRLRFEDGAVRVVAEGAAGRRLQQEQALAVIGSALTAASSITRSVDLPVETLLPQVTADNLDELGIVELVGEGSSSFKGSAAYRVTNVLAGAQRMDGVLIAPDEEFSFNRQLGDVSAETGFVEGYAIIGNRTQLEWGGGVCQDSTTVFRAAFWAGLPITERHAHSFYISWYDRFGLGALGDGQGLDAAIFTGVQDLKFVNDTGSWLLMQVEVNEAEQILTIRLYGTRPERTVRIEGPYVSNEVAAPTEAIYIDDPDLPSGTIRQSDTARGGRDVLIYRVVTPADGPVRRDEFVTRFKPWPDIYLRGTGRP